MYKRKSLAENIRYHLLLSAAAITPMSINFAHAAENETENVVDETEVISVTGVRNSLKEAAFLKKNASQIMDAISAEDIGQLPDKNIAEALQRVTGVQIGRDETGAGSSFQVRGFSQNRVEVNGQSMANSGESRSSSFSNVDSSLFKAIEVIKSPTADMVEGAIGATVRLRTFQPLEFKKPVINVAVEGTKNSIADDFGGKLSLMGTNKIDLGDWGELGALVNLSHTERNTELHQYDSNWSPLRVDNRVTSSISSLTDQAVFRPDNINVYRRAINDTNTSFDTTIQWALNADVEFKVNYQSSSFEQGGPQQKLVMQTNNNDLYSQDQSGTVNLNETPTVVAFERDSLPGELQLQKIDGEDVFVPVAGTVKRYLLQSGAYAPRGFSTPVASQSASGKRIIDTDMFGLSAKIALTDSLYMEAEYAFASSTEYKNDYFANTDLSLATDVDDTPFNADALGTDRGVIDNTIVFADYNPMFDMPNFGVASRTGDDAAAESALLNSSNYVFKTINQDVSEINNEKDSLKIDFDWELDGDYITKLEFGYRYANNQVNRSRQTLEFSNLRSHSIFVSNWRCYDRNELTGTQRNKCQNDNPSYDWINEVMAEDQANGIYADALNPQVASGEGYLDPFIKTTDGLFPNTAGGETIPSWVYLDLQQEDFQQLVTDFFPGRDGDCLLKEAGFDTKTGVCETRLLDSDGEIRGDLFERGEFDHILNIPQARLEQNQAYPYLITENTQAVYFKVNFEAELFDMPILGNAGVRVVQTDLEALGVGVERFNNPATNGTFKDLDGQQVEQFNPSFISNSYTNTLPSLNLAMSIKDNLLLRFAFGTTISRPNTSDLSPSSGAITGFTTKLNVGNPLLVPEEAASYDLSLEWYIDDVNSLTAALFRKDLKNFLEKSFSNIISPEDRDDNGTLDDPITIEMPVNSDDGKTEGFELAANHTMEYLPGFMSGFGVQANYTFIDSNQESGFSELDLSTLPLVRLSENSYNLVFFYDKYGFNFRAAYNYRDENYEGPSGAGADPSIYSIETFLDRNGVSQTKAINNSIVIPTWNDEFETLDVSVSYKYKNATFFLQGTNILNEAQRRYVGDKTDTKNFLRFLRETGATYTAGVRMRF